MFRIRASDGMFIPSRIRSSLWIHKSTAVPSNPNYTTWQHLNWLVSALHCFHFHNNLTALALLIMGGKRRLVGIFRHNKTEVSLFDFHP